MDSEKPLGKTGRVTHLLILVPQIGLIVCKIYDEKYFSGKTLR